MSEIANSRGGGRQKGPATRATITSAGQQGAIHQDLNASQERRAGADEPRDILHSTGIATILLDVDLNIRFFTPATKAVFNVIPGDIGRPLADLSALAVDDALLTDARSVLRTLMPREREVEALGGALYIRRISPYRTRPDR